METRAKVRKIYDPYSDPKLTARQGGVAQGGFVSRIAEGVGTAATAAPGMAVEGLRRSIGAPVSAAAMAAKGLTGRLSTDREKQVAAMEAARINAIPPSSPVTVSGGMRQGVTEYGPQPAPPGYEAPVPAPTAPAQAMMQYRTIGQPRQPGYGNVSFVGDGQQEEGFGWDAWGRSNQAAPQYDVSFDQSVSPAARAAFSRAPVRPTAQINRYNNRTAQYVGGMRQPPQEGGETWGDLIVQGMRSKLARTYAGIESDAARNALTARGQDIGLQEAGIRDITARRGQDIGVEEAAQRQALEQQRIGLAQPAAEAAQYGLQRTKLIDDLNTQIANEPDEGKKAALVKKRMDLTGAVPKEPTPFTLSKEVPIDPAQPALGTMTQQYRVEGGVARAVGDYQQPYSPPPAAAIQKMLANKGDAAYEQEFIARYGSLPY